MPRIVAETGFLVLGPKVGPKLIPTNAPDAQINAWHAQ
jgi:hypothetical protein